MSTKRSEWLPLWVLLPLVLFAVILALVLSLPEGECGEEATDGAEGAILATIAVVAAVLALGAGLVRLAAMVFRRRDGWILLASLLVVAVTGVAYAPAQSFGAGVAIGCLALTGLALLALVAAALSRRSVDDVGILLPIYLFGATYVYLATAGIGLLASSGIGC